MESLGIGGNTAIFSIINATLLNPLPDRNAGRLVVLMDVHSVLDPMVALRTE